MIVFKQLRFVLIYFYLMFTSNVLAQKTVIRSFLDPVVQKEIIDVAVNDKQKRLATLEIGGTIHVYDLLQRKILFFTKHNQEEISEGGSHQSNSRRLVRFDDSGELLGFFNKQNGFTLLHAANGDSLLELKWIGQGSEKTYQSPLPYDLKFIGDFLLLQFVSENSDADKLYDNNAFIIDIKNGRLLNIYGKEGFNCPDDFLENADSTKQVSVYAQKPGTVFKVEIFWKGKPIRQGRKLNSTQPLQITNTGIKNLSYDDATFDEEEELEDKLPTLAQLKKSPDEDSSLHKRLRAAIRQNNDWKTIFGSQEKPDEMYTAIDRLQFSLEAVDKISDYELRKYSIEQDYYNIIEVLLEGQPLQYFMERKQPGSYRFQNAYFINSVRKFALQSKASNYWQLLWPGENGMIQLGSFSDQDGFNILSCIIVSPSGNKIAWGVNEGRSTEIYGLHLQDGKLKRILKIPSVPIEDGWIRNDFIMGNFRQLNVFRFVDDDYFFVQGKRTGQNNLFFETSYWTIILEQPLAGNKQAGSKSDATKNLFVSNGKILLDNSQIWTYNTNLFEPVLYKQNSDNYDYDYDNINITDYKSLDQNFLKKIRLRNDSNGKILFGDGSQFIEITKDENNRIKWVHHAGNLKIEYYPHLTMLDIGDENMDQVKNQDPNYYTDSELSADLRLSAGNGRKIILRSPFGASRGYFKAGFSDDKNFVFSLSGHNYIDIWKSLDGSYLATIIPYDKNDFLIIDKDNHYYTTNPASLRNFYLQVNGRIYPVEELDIYQNRPDTILKSLSFINNEQLKEFYKEWVKRRQQAAGVAESDHSSRPVVTINDSTIPLATNNKELVFSFTIDHQEHVEIAYLYINNIIIDSLSLFTNKMEGSFKAQLQRGSNKIQVIAKDKNNRQSLRETIYTNYEPANSSSSNMVGLAMGVSTYHNEKYNLQYAAKDAKDLTQKLNSLPNIKIFELINEEATSSMLENVTKQFKQLEEDDVAVFYLAGHGALDKKGQFYYCIAETDLSTPEKSGISMKQLQSFFNQFKARRRLLILDACHSGSTGNLQLNGDSSVDQVAGLKTRGNIVISKDVKGPSISSRNHAEILKQQLYDAGSSNGVHVFSATSGAGLAYESNAWNNGVFTMMLMKGIEKNESDIDGNNQIDLSELVKYVSEQVKITTRGLQVPESTLIKWDNNWILIE